MIVIQTLQPTALYQTMDQFTRKVLGRAIAFPTVPESVVIQSFNQIT